jgi:hypothetical protein
MGQRRQAQRGRSMGRGLRISGFSFWEVSARFNLNYDLVPQNAKLAPSVLCRSSERTPHQAPHLCDTCTDTQPRQD